MANIQHSALTGSDLHEPKGVATANSGEVYIANGAGSGNWTNAFQYAGIHTFETDAVSISTIGTTAQTFPFQTNGQSNGITADATNNRLTVGADGVYMVFFHATISTTAAGDAGAYEFKIMEDGVATGFASSREMSGSNDTGVVSACALLSLSSGSHVTVEIESDEAGNTDDVDVYAAELTAIKVG